MPKRILYGMVIRDAAEKTVVVRVDRQFRHPLYKKFIRRSKKYAVHDENNRYKTGDSVRIQECPPISKRKRWILLSESA